MTTLKDIEALAQKFGQARENLATAVNALEAKQAETRRQHMAAIRRLVKAAKTAEAALRDAVEAASELFEKPRTRTLHGIKCGYQKGKGKIEWDDAEQVVKLIRRHMADQADDLIKTTEVPVRAVLNGLSAAELRKIGVTLQEAGDEIVVKTTDSEVDKIVEALLKDDGES